MAEIIDLAAERDRRQALNLPDLDAQQRDQLREILKAALTHNQQRRSCLKPTAS